MLAPNLAAVSVRACPSHEVLLTLEGRLFKESCVVRELEGEEAQLVVAACLADDAMELAS